MVNYQLGKIYRIVNDELNLTYYGSTCSTLSRRLTEHKQRAHKCSSKILFSTETKAEIILVEKFPCNDKIELHQRERFYIENNECVNKVIPCRTKKEYREDNKEEIYLKRKEYREQNKEKIKEQNKKYQEENKEKINLQRKQYRQDNKEKIKEQHKEYYEKNKEKENLRCKKYKEENKEKVKAQAKQYRQDNKELLKEKDKLQYQKRKEYYRQRWIKKKLLKSQND